MLTKPWLMGVRRGWLSLLKPKIHSWNDVERAVGRLQTFVENLREQVLNERQTSEKEKVDAALQALLKQIKGVGDTAHHWRACCEDKIPRPSAYDREQGQQMFDLFRSDFESAIERSKPQRGKSGLVRPAPLTEFLDDALKLLYADATYLQKQKKVHEDIGQEMALADPVFREFDFHGMRIVVVDPKHNGQRIRGYVPYIEMAYKDLARKGFKDTWYGILFLMTDDYETLSKEQQAAYAEAGYEAMEKRAGAYHSGADVVQLSVPISSEVVHAIAHEMGHRYWFRFMSQGQRARFESLIEGDWSMLHALLLNRDKLGKSPVLVNGTLHSDPDAFTEKLFEKAEAGRDLAVHEKDFVRRRFDELKLRGLARAGVPLVSKYARSRPTEAFAEVFERYVTERDMTRDQVESFRSVLVPGKGGGGARLAKKVALVKRTRKERR